MSSNSASSTKASYVPDSSPGAVIARGASGYGAAIPPTSWASWLASDHCPKPPDSGPTGAYGSLVDRQVGRTMLPPPPPPPPQAAPPRARAETAAEVTIHRLVRRILPPSPSPLVPSGAGEGTRPSGGRPGRP